MNLSACEQAARWIYREVFILLFLGTLKVNINYSNFFLICQMSPNYPGIFQKLKIMAKKDMVGVCAGKTRLAHCLNGMANLVVN